MANLLLVDDSNLTLKRMKRAFEEAGHTVSMANNGREALEVVGDSNPFDVIVSDVHMPEMTGLELVEALRKKGIEGPIVVCTADLQETTKEKALQLGANKVLNKPDLYTSEKVQKQMNELLKDQ